MKRKRKNYKPEEKVAILKRHLIDKVPVSDLCDEYNLQPTVFYRWQRSFFQNGSAAFVKDTSRRKRQEAQRVKALEEKLQRKHEVLSELMEEHVKLKKKVHPVNEYADFSLFFVAGIGSPGCPTHGTP